MRQLITFPVCVHLLAAFFQAPFFHVHERPDSEHVRKFHRAFIQTLHTHFPQAMYPGLSTLGLEFHAVLDRNEAKFLSWFQAELEGKLVFLARPLEAAAFSLPEQTFQRTPKQHMQLARDPPVLSPYAPRSPPFNSRLLRAL